MTVKELWEHFNNFPNHFALKDGNITEITPDKNRMEELVKQYADRCVKDWNAGVLSPSYYLHVWLESEDSQKEKDNG